MAKRIRSEDFLPEIFHGVSAYFFFYQRGKRVEGCWVFGGCERLKSDGKLYKRKNKAGRMFSCIIKDRTQKTLIPLIKKYIAPGTLIISDKWKAYNKISQLNDCFYRHLTVNHSKEFKDKKTGTCTNTIKGHGDCS